MAACVESFTIDYSTRYCQAIHNRVFCVAIALDPGRYCGLLCSQPDSTVYADAVTAGNDGSGYTSQCFVYRCPTRHLTRSCAISSTTRRCTMSHSTRTPRHRAAPNSERCRHLHIMLLFAETCGTITLEYGAKSRRLGGRSSTLILKLI